MHIPVAKPVLRGNEIKYVTDCLETGWVSSIGKYIDEFEREFAEFIGVKHAICTSNGTTALHLALLALNLRPGDEVLIPTVTFVATANAVRYCGAIPVLLDVDPLHLNILTSEIEKNITGKTVGIIAVHLYGQPADMEEINLIAAKHNLWVVEDAAEAHGASTAKGKVGGLSEIGTFSFFGNKILTTGEGGMVTTNDGSLAEKVRLLRGQGMDPTRRYWFPILGYNYRMTNIQAALGLAQLENIEDSLSFRENLAAMYDQNLSALDDFLLTPHPRPGTRHVFWMYTVFLRHGGERERDQLMKNLLDAGIETRPVFYPMHVLPPHLVNKDFPNADLWAYRGINLPTHEDMSIEKVKFVCQALEKFLMY